MNLGVGICSYNRPQALHRLCNSLLPHAPIFVADDGSTTPIARAVPWPVELRFFPHRGLASARNRLLQNLFARDAVDAVLILDDDMEAQPGWRDAWSAAIAAHDVVAFWWGGGTSGCATGLTRSAFDRLGFFDPRYDDGWGYEDADYFRRWLRYTGRDVAPFNTALIHHGGKGENCSPERLERNAELFNRT